MQKTRIRFKKTGNARYISHLDLMRAMIRAFKRAGLPVKHTEGFNPHPHLVFGNPLSLGFESICELCDFELTEEMGFEEVKKRLMDVLPSGLDIISVYEPVMKQGDIAYSKYIINIDCSKDYLINIKKLFENESIILSKKSKSGVKDINIIPLIKSIEVKEGESGIEIETILCAGSTNNLNPEMIVRAIKENIPPLSECFAEYTRAQLYDKNLNVFK